MSSAQETPAPRTIRRTFSQGNKSEEELIKRVVVWEAFARGITVRRPRARGARRITRAG